jgi:hypothetical protein
VELVNRATCRGRAAAGRAARDDGLLLVDRAMVFGSRGEEILVLAAKATFDLRPPPRPGAERPLEPADEPEPFSLIDTFAGTPGASSLILEAELGPRKPRTDCVLYGHARPARAGDTRSAVRFSVGAVTRTAVVFGPRVWRSNEPGEPLALDPVPLQWELGFGGADDSPVDPRTRSHDRENPIGRGFFAETSTRDPEGELLPQIEDPSDLLTRPGQRCRPMGFGFVARHWAPRAGYAGTYDDAWIRERMPLLPDDFDPRFHQAAPAALTAPRFQGAEVVRAEGVSPGGPLSLVLPVPSVDVIVRFGFTEVRVPLAVDTVKLRVSPSEPARLHIDEGARLTLLLKAELDVTGKVDALDELRFEGTVTS